MVTDYLTCTAAAESLGIGVAGVHHAIQRGRIPAFYAEDQYGKPRAVALHKDSEEKYRATRKGGRTPVSAAKRNEEANNGADNGVDLKAGRVFSKGEGR